MAGMFGAGVDPKIGFLMPFMQGAGDFSAVQNMLNGGGYQPAASAAFNYGAPSSGGSGIFGAYGGGGGGMPSTPNDLYNMTRQANQDTRAYNRGMWNDVAGYTRGVPQRFGADPLNQGARGLAAGLVANPEAINDRVQQRMVNRASNLANAASNAQRAGMRQNLLQRGVAGGTQERAQMDRIERGRQAGLMGLGSDIEAQRAIRRNADIQGAAGLASNLAGQQGAFDQAAAQTLMSGVPYEAPDDFSGLAALMASGGMFGGSGLGFGGMNLGYNRNRNSAPQMGFAGNWTAPQQEGPFVSQYGTYNDNFRPRAGYSSQGNLYSNPLNGQAYQNPFAPMGGSVPNNPWMGGGSLFGGNPMTDEVRIGASPWANNPALAAALNPGGAGAEINQRLFPAMF